MAVKPSKHEKDISARYIHLGMSNSFSVLTILCSFARIAKLITENGGKVVDLTDAKLTHVVIDKRDESRRLELIRRTSK